MVCRYVFGKTISRGKCFGSDFDNLTKEFSFLDFTRALGLKSGGAYMRLKILDTIRPLPSNPSE